MYRAVRPLLFSLDPERAHDFTLSSLDTAYRMGVSKALFKTVQKPVQLMGLTFPNAVGLSAGLDKNGDHIDALGSLGFGFLEIGTVTPKAQSGNDKPRMFRLSEQHAIINRMGFNNLGVDHLVSNAAKRMYKGVLGINVGKNASTPLAEAVQDYRLCIRAAHAYADYLTVNISSPNTPGLRDLQKQDDLAALAGNLVQLVAELNAVENRRVPLLVKIAPDLNGDEIKQVADALVGAGIDGVIATNTTLDKSSVSSHKFGSEQGGLSGAPVRERSTQVIATLASHLKGELPIIGVGGIETAEHAKQKLDAGASLVQLYSGLIYQGPRMVSKIAASL